MKKKFIIIFFTMLVFLIVLIGCVRKKEGGEPWSEFADASCRCYEVKNNISANCSLINSTNSEKFTRILGKQILIQSYICDSTGNYLYYYDFEKLYWCGCKK